LDDHSSANRVATAVKLPTRAFGLKFPVEVSARPRVRPGSTWADLSTQGPYSALLRVGLAMPVLLPSLRWALTPPFHHHRWSAGLTPRTAADFSLWRFPWGCPRWALPSTLSSWSPDFPRRHAPAIIQPSAQGAL